VGLITWLVVGLIAGGLARAFLPGPDPMSLLQTLLLGLVGSFVGGFLFNLLGPGSIFSLRRAGLLGSILGALISLAVWRAVRNQREPKNDAPA
jgi:uncharacterized membrane protein YeaQ/YmgE (transglycosylase-associated protein family)